ncbi:MAG: GntR family transcriptional regulator [Actinomycetes bacterium]
MAEYASSRSRPNGRAAGRPVKRERFAEEVATELRDMILAGTLALGERIDQDAVAEAHGMSRLPVREALIALEQEGLVVNTPRRGAYVAQLTPEDVHDQYEVYGLVAGIAAARAAERLSAAESADLRRAHEQFVKARGGAAQQRSNEEFHRIINRVAGSRLRSTLGLLARSLPSHHYMFDSEWAKLAQHHHEQVLVAIERRDPAKARAAMTEHLVASGHQAVVALTGKGFWSGPRAR